MANMMSLNISDEVINKLNSCYSAIGQNKVHLNKRGLAFAIAAQITHVERSFLLNELSEHYNVNIHTASKCGLSPKVSVHGPVKYFDEMTWRKASFKISFNEKMEKSLAYKKKTFKKLMENYNILLLVEDHPEVIAWAKSKKIDTLVPATGYKDLNGTDLTEKEDA